MNHDTLIDLLADGEFHSGELLGAQLHISRAAVWKRLQALIPMGIPVEKVRGRGYRIPGGLQRLSAEALRQQMTAEGVVPVGPIDIWSELDSTNAQLLRDGTAVSGQVCLAERQTAGKGRRGRTWHSPYGRNLYLSIAWHYHQGVAVLEGLSLAVGVVLAETLQDFGLDTVQLKWPNDLLCQGQKLGGILIEVGGDVSGECKVVVGVGLNVAMSDLSDIDASIDQPWTDLKSAGLKVNRNTLCARFLARLIPLLQSFPEQTFSVYRQRWQALNAHQGARVVLSGPGRAVPGEVLGVDERGGLRLLTGQGEQCFSGGEISLRLDS